MDSELVLMGGMVGALIAIFVSLMLITLAADSSSWQTYHDDGKYCITLTQYDNHVFSPDKTYVDNWCK